MSSSNAQELLKNEDYLQFLHSRLLDDHRDFLCKDGRINPKHHYPYLRTKRILNREICAEIDNVVGPQARANRFIDELQRNGSPKALVYFLESLKRDRSQIFILRRLNEALANMRNSLPLMAEFQHNGDGGVLKHQQSREFEESSITSEGEVSSNSGSLEEGQQASASTTLLRPGEPGAPPLPSFERLTSFPGQSDTMQDDTDVLNIDSSCDPSHSL